MADGGLSICNPLNLSNVRSRREVDKNAFRYRPMASELKKVSFYQFEKDFCVRELIKTLFLPKILKKEV